MTEGMEEVRKLLRFKLLVIVTWVQVVLEIVPIGKEKLGHPQTCADKH